MIRDTQKDGEPTGFAQGHGKSFQQSMAKRWGFLFSAFCAICQAPAPLGRCMMPMRRQIAQVCFLGSTE